MKLWERIFESRAENKFGFQPGKSTIDPIFTIKLLMEECREKQKTEYMTTGEQHSDLRVEQQQINRVEKFKYLGTILSDDTSVTREVVHRQQKAWTTWKEVTGILFDKKISKRMKSEIYKRMIRPAMTYGSECLTVKKKENDKFEVTEMKMLRRIEGITVISMTILLCFVYIRHCVGAVVLYMLLLFQVKREYIVL